MNWDERYQIDVAFIDGQHREWFERVAKFGRAIDNGETREAMASVLRFVVEYTQKHFSDEEAYMHQHQYPGLAHQQELHKAFEKYIVDVLVNLKKGKEVPPVKLYEFMSDWMVQHIQEEDRKIGLYLAREDEADDDDNDGAPAGTTPDDLAARLQELTGLLTSELITEDDFEAKKQDMLKQFAEKQPADAASDALTKLEKIKELIAQGVLSDADLQIGRDQLAQTVNVGKELSMRDGVETKMRHIKQLFDEEIIDEVQFESHKAQILEQM